MVVNDPHSLHPRINDGGPDELESPPLQVLRDRFGQGGRDRDSLSIALYLFSLCEGPAVVVERLAALRHLAVDPCPADGRVDLGPGADDAGVAEQPPDVLRPELRDLL